jgi:tetratricopeptide (TPR) repeat protein
MLTTTVGLLRIAAVVSVCLTGAFLWTAAGQPAPAGAPDELEAKIAAQYESLRSGDFGEEGYVSLAELLRRADRSAEAVDGLRRGLAEFPESFRLRAELAESLVALGDFEGAIVAMKPVASDPRAKEPLAGIHFARGRTAFAEQLYFESLAAARRAVELEPGNPEYLQLEGSSYFALGQNTEARKRFEQLLQHDPGHVEAYYSLALIHLRSRDLTTAEEYLLEATTRGPGFTPAHFYLGRVYNAQNRNRLAVDEFTRALDGGGGELEDIYLHLGQAYKALGMYAQAIDALENQVSRDPESATSRISLGDSYLRTREWDAARRHLERAVELAPDRAAAHCLLARVLLEQGWDEEALTSLRQCSAADPDSEEPHYLMRQIYLRQGKLDLARQETELYTRKKRLLEYLRTKHAEGAPDPK